MDSSGKFFNLLNAGVMSAGAACRVDVQESATPSVARPYEKPQVIVIGNVRDLTAGSASSGNQDANSQYYW
jgi:hypothetical protein